MHLMGGIADGLAALTGRIAPARNTKNTVQDGVPKRVFKRDESLSAFLYTPLVFCSPAKARMGAKEEAHAN
jgi:hypothetical protein